MALHFSYPTKFQMKKIVYSLLAIATFSIAGTRSFAQQSGAIYNFNYNTAGFSSYFLPQFYSNDTVNAYAERFTMPEVGSTLDSVSVYMIIDSLGPTSAIYVAALPVMWSNGHSFANSNKILADDSIVRKDTDFHKDQAIFYTRRLGKPVISDTDFFLALITFDFSVRSAVEADSVTSATALPVDENRDRSRFFFTSPYQGNTQYFLAGNPYDSSKLYWYPNFVIIAYITTPANSVEELYPANRDPLSFIVERMTDGETVLHFSPTASGAAKLELYDENGRLVSTLFDGEAQIQQYALSVPNMKNGTYFAKLTSANVVETRRIVVAH